MIPDDIRAITDPGEALAKSTAGIAAQHAQDRAVARIVRDLEAIRRENHIAARMVNLQRARRF